MTTRDASRSRRVVRGAVVLNGGAAILGWALFLILLVMMADPAVAPASAAERLVIAVRLLVWPSALLLAMTVGVAMARVRTRAFNPIDDAESRTYRIRQRVLSNSVEQTAIFVPAFLGLAVALPPSHAGILSLAVGFFATGRALFWIGYERHPYFRAPGMSVTFNVNAGMVFYLLYALIAG